MQTGAQLLDHGERGIAFALGDADASGAFSAQSFEFELLFAQSLLQLACR
jgi:hypothetical protein